ncbi:MAG TPA: glycosyl hydrolase, partial [Gemmatimonadaceae bacterium]
VVLPGTYTVRMTVNGQSYRQPLTVVKDPRSAASDADLREQFDFLMRIHEKTNQANDAVKTIRNVKAQLADRTRRMPPDKSAAFAANTKSFIDRLSAIEGEIYQVKNQSGQDPLNYPIRLNNKIAALSGVVGGADAKPTSQSYTVFNDLSAQLDRQLSAMRGSFIILSPINASLKAQGLPPIVPSAEEIKAVPSRTAPAGSGEDEVEK